MTVLDRRTRVIRNPVLLRNNKIFLHLIYLCDLSSLISTLERGGEYYYMSIFVNV